MVTVRNKTMIYKLFICACSVLIHRTTNVNAFCTSKQQSKMRGLTSNTASAALTGTAVRANTSNDEFKCDKPIGDMVDRRNAIISTLVSLSTVSMFRPDAANADIEGVVAAPEASIPTASTSADEGGVKLFTTKSGLKYIELREGTGPTPKYGQLCSISYKAYIKLPDSVSSDKKISTKLQEFDSDNAFLVKHGNGRILPGLDEGLHTIRVGGKRRIIVPPKLGFVSNGLGPLPETPWGRYKLNQLLNQMVEVKGGNLVFDVELRSAFDDEADQGYYEDRSLTPEQFQTLRNNFERGAREEREKQKMAAGIGEV
uniref:peptidylprolyl isomerase n=1 Tax=Ditylum brightwellii TaxID=49249 RepID=A0A6U3SBH4_9STRA